MSRRASLEERAREKQAPSAALEFGIHEALLGVGGCTRDSQDSMCSLRVCISYIEFSEFRAGVWLMQRSYAVDVECGGNMELRFWGITGMPLPEQPLQKGMWSSPTEVRVCCR